MDLRDSAPASPELRPDPKRRKVRRGTRSCWECKRRKVRCIFASSSDAVCNACRRRNTTCLDQEHPEEESRAKNQVEPVKDQMVRVEALLKRLVENDLDIIHQAETETPSYFHEANLRSYLELKRDGFQLPPKIRKMPSTHGHPVFLAKRMLLIAIFLHNMVRRKGLGLSESPGIITHRLADTAIRLVVGNDDLAGTMDHLECQMLEGTYHWGRGSIRRAWISWRKALLFAQSLGIHRPGASQPKTLLPGSLYNPQIVWFRIVYMDRFFSLMLRLPQGTPDVNIGCEAIFESDTLNRRLERVQAVIAARILERNDRDPALLDYSITQDIDAHMLKAAKSMPPTFWAAPNFDNLDMQSENGFWKTVRMVDQVFHYTLLIMLHLPYLLRFDADPRHEYSRLTCVNAGRDSMLRYIAFRNSNANIYCRPADFFALVASITVLLAHLGSHRNQGMASTLAHQRFGDRDVVEQVLDKMDASGRVTDDAMSTKSAELLGRLLHVEESAAQGQRYRAQMVEASDAHQEDEQNVLQISLPYFGLIRITREPTTSSGPLGELASSDTNQPADDSVLERANLSTVIQQNNPREAGEAQTGLMAYESQSGGSAKISTEVGQPAGEARQFQELHELAGEDVCNLMYDWT
ncbi:hypothetical protein GQ53DRAFT_801090 [Thozetella sp. PMI_491]|nr:hypothetical protein GQ53DRAFT_801090 [Thozetella sp. PMI_491]